MEGVIRSDMKRSVLSNIPENQEILNGNPMMGFSYLPITFMPTSPDIPRIPENSACQAVITRTKLLSKLHLDTRDLAALKQFVLIERMDALDILPYIELLNDDNSIGDVVDADASKEIAVLPSEDTCKLVYTSHFAVCPFDVSNKSGLCQAPIAWDSLQLKQS